MSKLFVFTEGGDNIGYGHLMRCLALSGGFGEFVKEQYFYLRGQNIDNSFINNINVEFTDWITTIDSILHRINMSDIVIIDSYFAPLAIYEELARRTSYLLILDDYGRLKFNTGIVLNPVAKIDYGKNATVLYGAEYIILRKSFWDVEKISVKEEVRNVLATLGGSKVEDNLDKIVDFLVENYNDFNYYVIGNCSIDNKNIISLGYLTEKEMLNIMKDTDIAVSAGGQTLHELARLGIPSIMVQISDNQKFNISFYEEKGIHLNAGDFRNTDFFSTLKIKMDEILDYNIRLKMQKNSEIVKGDGVRRVAVKLTEFRGKIYENKN